MVSPRTNHTNTPSPHHITTHYPAHFITILVFFERFSDRLWGAGNPDLELGFQVQHARSCVFVATPLRPLRETPAAQPAPPQAGQRVGIAIPFL